MDWHAFLLHPATQGAVNGIVAAAAIDYAAFRSWKSYSEARQYEWTLALWRWFQGGVYGLVGAYGYTSMVEKLLQP